MRSGRKAPDPVIPYPTYVDRTHHHLRASPASFAVSSSAHRRSTPGGRLELRLVGESFSILDLQVTPVLQENVKERREPVTRWLQYTAMAAMSGQAGARLQD